MRLIDADWVFAHIKPYEPSDEEWSVTGGTALRLIHNAVDDAPTMDAELIINARWIRYPDCGVTKCFHCNWSIEECWDSKRCPECGAHMRNGE